MTIGETSSLSLLVADDEVEIAEIVAAVAEDLGFSVTQVTEGSAVVETALSVNPRVIMLDLRMPGADGVEVMRALGKQGCKSAIILMSGMDQRTLSSVQALGKEQSLNIVGTLTKPMPLDAIESALLPFKTAEPEKEPSPRERSVSEFNFGLRVLYEPEFIFSDNGDKSVKRVRVHYTWRKDDGRLLANGPFLRWAEEAGITKGIFKAVVKLSLENLRVWSNQGFTPEMVLRLDSALLTELDLPDFLANLVDMNHVPRELLILEINESAIRNGKDLVWDVITRISIKGFKLSVFAEGNGENALGLLDKLAINQLVVDMSALPERANLANDMELEFAYSSLVSTAGKRGVIICAGNISGSDQFEFVRRCQFKSASGAQIHNADSAQNILELYKEGKFS